MSRVSSLSFAFIVTVVLSCAALAEPMSFRQAIALAAQRGAAPQAAADQARAHASYLEARNMYLPQVTVGSGLAKTWGFPLSIEGSAPSAFQVNYQSFLYNPAQREFVKSAKMEWQASSLTTQDQRAATLLETAVTYIQLDNLQTRIRSLHDEAAGAGKLEQIVTERVQAGVDTQLDLTQAKLNSARVSLSVAQAEGNAQVLRERLAQLTGVPATEIETRTTSIPEIPDRSSDPDLVGKVVAASPAVKSALEEAKAKEVRAKGEHRAKYPAIDLVGSYGLFTKYNNYDQYFTRFQRNNATLGVAIRFPFMNFAQDAHADAADAEAVKARRAADAARDQVATETLKLGSAVRQLAASQQVSDLEYKLAQAQAEAIQTRIQSQAPGQGTGERPPSPSDLEQARLDAFERYGQFLDSNFELQKARLQLLRATGELEQWALAGK